ncbi:MAG: hypothetical protein MI974_29145 [Chitinophagales bacterium]|nr:hypothetical protein [Chitinophagales bacterium]
MKRMIQKLLLLIFACMFGYLSHAQIVITPLYQNAEVFVADHLIQVNMINVTPDPIVGHLEIQISGPDQQLVGQINSFEIGLQPGIVLNGNRINWEAGFTFGNSAFASAFRNTGKLPFGEFTICYRFIDKGNGNTLGLNCQEKNIKVAGLPKLVTPFDQSVLDNIHPLLSWLPPLPLTGSELTYSIVLAEIKKGQSPAEAVSFNIPLLSLDNIKQTSLRYPASGQLLQEKSEYAWQITAYWNNIEIGKTEIWRFSFKPLKNNEISRAPEDFNHFFGLTQNALARGGYHVRKDAVLPLLYNNRGLENVLNYTIREVGSDGEYLTNLPEILMVPGINHIELDLDGVGGLAYDKRYLLHAVDAKGADYYLEFINLRVVSDTGGN